jgi:hypothetical protein
MKKYMVTDKYSQLFGAIVFYFIRTKLPPSGTYRATIGYTSSKLGKTLNKPWIILEHNIAVMV